MGWPSLSHGRGVSLYSTAEAEGHAGSARWHSTGLALLRFAVEGEWFLDAQHPPGQDHYIDEFQLIPSNTPPRLTHLMYQ